MRKTGGRSEHNKTSVHSIPNFLEIRLHCITPQTKIAFRNAIAIALLFCQSPSNLFAQNQETVFRSSSRLVQVTVVVHDKKGQPVRDLAKDDFTLLDNGAPQAITFFEKQVAEPSLAPASTTPGQLTITNRTPLATKNATGVTIVLFDSLNSSATTDLQKAKQELMKFLRTIQPTDPVALYSLAGPQVRIVHDFSENTSSLIEAAQQVNDKAVLGNGAPAGPALTGRFQAMGELMEQAARSDMQQLAALRIHYTLAALENIAHHVASIPGRKSLVWISSSFPINLGLDSPSMAKGDTESFYAQVKRVAKILTDVEVSVYPVDPSGLTIDARYGAEMADGRAINEIRRGTMTTEGEKRFPSFRSMDILAAETGGIAYYNRNDLGKGIQRAMDDGAVTYLLGFHPAETAWDGRFHDLVVKVNRPNLETRSRKGYFATAKLVESAPERDNALQYAVFSPFDGSSIGLTVSVKSNPMGAGAQSVALRVDPRDLRFEKDRTVWQADADFVFVQLAADGRLLKGQIDSNHWDLPDEKYTRAMDAGLEFQRSVAILPEAVKLRIVVRDPATGAVGSVSVPIKTSAR